VPTDGRTLSPSGDNEAFGSQPTEMPRCSARKLAATPSFSARKLAATPSFSARKLAEMNTR
jgi:hypothetical protein